MLDKLLDGIISDADYRTKNQELDGKLHELGTKMQNLQSRLGEQKSVKERLEEIKNKLEHGGIEKAKVNQMLGETENYLSVFLDYPFEPTTERGRKIDRRRVWELLQEDPCLTAKKIAAQMHRSYGIVVTRMRELRKDGYIQYEGKGGHGYWKAVKEYPDFRKQNRGCG